MATKRELLARLDKLTPGHQWSVTDPKNELEAAVADAESVSLVGVVSRPRRTDRLP